jgi:hypothetical protein
VRYIRTEGFCSEEACMVAWAVFSSRVDSYWRQTTINTIAANDGYLQ